MPPWWGDFSCPVWILNGAKISTFFQTSKLFQEKLRFIAQIRVNPFNSWSFFFALCLLALRWCSGEQSSESGAIPLVGIAQICLIGQPSRRPWPIGLPPSRLGIAQAASRLALLSLLRRFIARFWMFVAIASCLVIGEPSGLVIIVPSFSTTGVSS